MVATRSRREASGTATYSNSLLLDPELVLQPERQIDSSTSAVKKMQARLAIGRKCLGVDIGLKEQYSSHYARPRKWSLRHCRRHRLRELARVQENLPCYDGSYAFNFCSRIISEDSCVRFLNCSPSPRSAFLSPISPLPRTNLTPWATAFWAKWDFWPATQ